MNFVSIFWFLSFAEERKSPFRIEFIPSDVVTLFIIIDIGIWNENASNHLLGEFDFFDVTGQTPNARFPFAVCFDKNVSNSICEHRKWVPARILIFSRSTTI